MGTVNLLESMRKLSNLRAAVMVTTDKVYRNKEWIWPYREDDVLGGHDPYSASKAASEIVIECYRKSFFSECSVGIATARAGNVIGGGDWSKDRLIPDVIRAWQAGETLFIRNPGAIRPWQHVLEPLTSYMTLAERLWCDPKISGAYNFGPEPSHATSVKEVVEIALQLFGSGKLKFGDELNKMHEAGLLTLEIAKAKSTLGISPKWSLPIALEKTMNWYKHQSSGQSAYQICLADIKAFKKLA